MDKMDRLLQRLRPVRRIAVDAEGMQLNRFGKLCLISIALPDKSTWLIDVSTLGQQAFTYTHASISLKSVLEDPGVEKLFFDVRCDSDALYHQHGVGMKGVYDVQLAEVAFRRHVLHIGAHYVVGLTSFLMEHLSPASKVGLLMQGDTKKVVRDMMNADAQFWERRPLTDLHIKYAANDVAFLLEAHERIQARLDGLPSKAAIDKVRQASQVRVEEYMMTALPPQGKSRTIAPKWVL